MTRDHDIRQAGRLQGAMFAAVALASLMACTSQPGSPVPSDEFVASAVPVPEGSAVLTMSGLIENRNVGPDLAFDMATLDALSSATLNVFEPFLKERVTFSGVPVRNLLTTAGSPAHAKNVVVTALDDYSISFDLGDLVDSEVLLATRQEGARMKVEDGGPIRLIFPDGSSLGENTDMWVWSVESMAVEAGP